MGNLFTSPKPQYSNGPSNQTPNLYEKSIRDSVKIAELKKQNKSLLAINKSLQKEVSETKVSEHDQKSEISDKPKGE